MSFRLRHQRVEGINIRSQTLFDTLKQFGFP